MYKPWLTWIKKLYPHCWFNILISNLYWCVISPQNAEISRLDCGSSLWLPSLPPSLYSLSCSWSSRSSRLSESPTIPAVSAAWCVKRVWMECLSPWTWRTTSTASKTTTRKEDASLLHALLLMFCQCVRDSSCGCATCNKCKAASLCLVCWDLIWGRVKWKWWISISWTDRI